MGHWDTISQTPGSEAWGLSVTGLPVRREGKKGSSKMKGLNSALVN